MPLPVLAAGAARMAASGAAKKAASGAAKQVASGVANKAIAPKPMGGFGVSTKTSPAALANKKTGGDSALFSESQQEIALRMAHSEITNKEAAGNNIGETSPSIKQSEDPIKARINQQLEIRREQQEGAEDNEESTDENSQEEQLSQSKNSARASMASMALQVGEQLAQLQKKITFFLSLISTIISFGSVVIGFFAPILVPLLIIAFCFALVYNYISEYKISGGYQIMTGQFEELLNDAITNTPPDDSAATSQNQNSE